jgi:hypothetical protein
MMSERATPEIMMKMRVNRFHVVKCPTCKGTHLLGDLIPSLYVDIDPAKFRAPDFGGNGYNYYCPYDNTVIYAPRW